MKLPYLYNIRLIFFIEKIFLKSVDINFKYDIMIIVIITIID